MTTTPVLQRNQRILEARTTFQKALDGDFRARADVMESMTTADFPILLGAAYGRELLQEYQGIAPVWQKYSRRSVVPNFKPKKLVELLGGRAGLSKVKEASEYPARGLTEAEYEFKVEKYGDRIPLTWEMFINDELDAFRNLPERLGTAARETEDIVAASAFFNAGNTGLNTAFFRAQNGNAPVTGAEGALSADNVEAALQAISTRKDKDGRPIVVSGSVLMVPPALEMQARKILTATEIRRTDGNTTTTESNHLSGVLTLVVNPWLPVVASGFSGVNRTWFVLPAPNSPRPAHVTGFLRGNEQPDLRVKNDAGNRVVGGSVAPEEGSFDDDTVQYRVRHSTGSSLVIPTGTFVATGNA
jgi:hypothetical protein